MVLTSHHILMDGWSMPVLLRELSTVYAGGGGPRGVCRGDAVPGVSGVVGRGRTRGGAWGVAGGVGGGGGADVWWRRRIRGGIRWSRRA